MVHKKKERVKKHGFAQANNGRWWLDGSSFTPHLQQYLNDLGLLEDIPLHKRQREVLDYAYRKERPIEKIFLRTSILWSGGRFCKFCASEYRMLMEYPRGADGTMNGDLQGLAQHLERYKKANVRWIFVRLLWSWYNQNNKQKRIAPGIGATRPHRSCDPARF